MRQILLIMMMIVPILGCSEQDASEQGGAKVEFLLISESPKAYVSSDPIVLPVTFWFGLTEDDKQLVADWIGSRSGSPIATFEVRGPDGEPQPTEPVISATMSREVMILQGDTVLYRSREDLTAENLDRLASWTTHSDAWSQAPSTDEDLTFRVKYWRAFKMSLGSGGHPVLAYDFILPLAKVP